MDEMKFYYLDGSERKGPFTIREINKLGLSDETLVFDDFDNKWRPYIEFNFDKNFRDFSEVKKPQEKPTKKIKANRIIVFIIMILCSSVVAYILALDAKNSDFKNFKSKIDDMFGGKPIVYDYSYTSVEGELLPESKLPLFPNECEYYLEKNYNIHEYFECKDGGWGIFALKKLNVGYDIIKYISENMAFIVPEYKYIKGSNEDGIIDRYGNYPSITIPTFRGTVENAYIGARDYLIEEDLKNYNQDEIARKVASFDMLNSDFHNMENIDPTQYSNSTSGHREINYPCSIVYDEKSIVVYKKNIMHYEIVLDKELFQKRIMTNLLFGFALSILGFIVWLLFTRKQ